MWFKGNIHTHTNRSDGDSDPEAVVDWYRRNGYDFLVLTDHNHVTVLEHGARVMQEGPLMIPGEEVSVELEPGRDLRSPGGHRDQGVRGARGRG